MTAFVHQVLQYYEASGRILPWRLTADPYAILVSESMLQQTQVERVIPKYQAFLAAVPTVQDLAVLPIADLLTLWQGLGYNRRALNLQKAAQQIVSLHEGQIPEEYEALCGLSGIGPYTAAAIRAFAFDAPSFLLETNVRRVFLHCFFPEHEGVHDIALRPYIEEAARVAAASGAGPRIWNWALMDYGAMLARAVPNPNRRSKQYVRQSTFRGSTREIRGALVRAAAENKTLLQVAEDLRQPYSTVRECADTLIAEGFIVLQDEVVHYPVPR